MAYVTPATIGTMVGAAAMPATGTSCWAFLYRDADIVASSAMPAMGTSGWAYLYRSATVASVSAMVANGNLYWGYRYLSATAVATAANTSVITPGYAMPVLEIIEAVMAATMVRIRKQTPAFMFPRPRTGTRPADDDTLHNNTLIAVGFDADGLGIIYFKET